MLKKSYQAMPALGLECLLHIPQLALVPLDGLVGLGVGLVGMIKGNLQVIDVTLQLLLDPESLLLGLALSL